MAKKSRKLKPRDKAAISRRKAVVTMPGATWDVGAMGPANRAGLKIEPAADIDPETGKVINPNGVLRARRVDVLELYHKREWISTAGYNAAEKLRNAFEATMKAPGWPDNERVQSSPKPDHAVTIKIDRISRFHRINRLVPQEHREIIDACVFMGATPSWLKKYRGRNAKAGRELLAAALDALAQRMGA